MVWSKKPTAYEFSCNVEMRKGRPSQQARRRRAMDKISHVKDPIPSQQRVNAPCSTTDVLFGILMLFNVIPFLTSGRDGSPVPEPSIAVVKITSLLIGSGKRHNNLKF